MKKILIATAIGLACMGAHAQDTAKMLWFITGGYSVGGDTLASGTYTSGQTFSIKAGEGFLLSGGLSFPVANRVDLQASVGFHSTSTNATNGKIEALVDYLNAADAHDAAWLLALLTGRRPKRTVPPGRLREVVL